MAVVIETTLGDITVDLFTDRRPQTCKNFLKLCKIKYYNFCLFHSIQANFIAQTGDPSGSGTGGESIFGVVYGSEKKYYEAEKVPKIKHDKPGLLSMVNCGNSMLGSQFFVTLGSDLSSLDEHCVFAEVTEGLEILVKLNDAICDHQHRPYQDIRITHTVVLDDPYDDLPGLLIPDASPDISFLELTPAGRIGADEKINDDEGLTEGQLEELKADREAKARATILEIVGDLPDADFAPPENVLFVCKLNPVTSDDDLEIIFSRFGKVKSCEVIRDHQTGDSLQYAFVEFEDQRSCEQAFLKMDNVLIDDRRIHVDFSQSVSKVRWRGKGKGVLMLDEGDHRDIGTNGSRPSKRDNNKEKKRDRDTRERDRKEDDRDKERRRDEDRRRRGTDRDPDDRRRDRRKEDGSRRRDDEGWRQEEERRRAVDEDRRRGFEEERRRGVEEEHRRAEDDRFVDQKRKERDDRRRDDDRRYGNSRRDERRREDDRRRHQTSTNDDRKNGESSRSERDRSRDVARDASKSKIDSLSSNRSEKKESDSKKPGDRKVQKASYDRHESLRKDKPPGNSSHKNKDESPRNPSNNGSNPSKTESTPKKMEIIEESKVMSPERKPEGIQKISSATQQEERRNVEHHQQSVENDQCTSYYHLSENSFDQPTNNSYDRRTSSVEEYPFDKDSNDRYNSIPKHRSRMELDNVSHKSSIIASEKSKKKKKRKRKQSSSSSSSSSESSDSSSSSSSANRRKKKRSVTVVKKSYHRGKLVKVIKKKKRKSSDSETSESSESDRRKRKPKYKKVVKVIKKRRHHSSDDSDSSSSEDSDNSSISRKRKKHEKSSKRKRKDSSKKCKKKKMTEPSGDEFS